MTQQPARLITPKGKAIDLPPDVYRQVRHLLVARAHRRSRARMTVAIQAAYGKYAGGPSLTQALLEERTAERHREDTQLKR